MTVPWKPDPVLKLPADTVQGPGRYPVSVMTVIRSDPERIPGITVSNEGETDFILTLKKETAGRDPGLVQDGTCGFHCFFRCSFAIMTFNNDVDIQDFSGSFMNSLPAQVSDGFTILEVTSFHRDRSGSVGLF